jgi:hypothetical protein
MECLDSLLILSSTRWPMLVRDPNGRAYNRTAYLPERRKMMQQWADYLDKLKAGEGQASGPSCCAEGGEVAGLKTRREADLALWKSENAQTA